MRALLFNLSCFNFTVASTVGRMLEEAGDPDVLFLNEVPPGRGAAFERALGPEWAGAREWSSRFVGVMGFQQALYVRRPASAIALGSVALGRGRSALFVRIEHPESTVLAGVAHLTAEKPVKFGQRAPVRERQLDQLITAVRQRADDGEPLVIGGDFNYARGNSHEVEHSKAADRLERALDIIDVAQWMHDAAGAAGPPPATWPSPGTPSLWLPAQRFDLFYVSRPLIERVRMLRVLRWAVGYSGSDHLPVVMEIDEPS